MNSRRKGLFSVVIVVLFKFLIVSAAILILWVHNNVIKFKTFSQDIDEEVT